MGILATAILAAVTLNACGIPRDSEGTLDRVEGDTMRVGITENPPWTDLSGGRPAGVEVDLIEGFAETLQAQVEWFDGSEAELMEALEKRELDVVVGGFAADDPWAQVVTFTQPYAETSTSVGVPPGQQPPQEIDGVRVATERGRETAALVEDAGGVPVEVDDLSGSPGLVAGEEWELETLGLVPSEIELDKAQHVVAVPLGENAWLVRLERFLSARAASVDELLQEHAA
jgi:polar amino acid transport system substrate-binding protein